MTGSMPVAQRIAEIAEAQGDEPAVIGLAGHDAPDRVVTWRELADRSAGLGTELAALRDRLDGPVAVLVTAPNRPETVVRFAACLHAEVPFLPVDPRAPESEVDALIQVLAKDRFVVRLDEQPDVIARPSGRAAMRPAGYFLATGGSSGTARLVEHPGPVRYDPVTVPNSMLRAVGWHCGQRQLIVGPLHHAAPFMCCWEGLLDANTIVLQSRFDARQMIRAIGTHRIEWSQLTPTHLQWALLALEKQPASLDCLRAIVHTAAHCPQRVKRAWIDRLGAERVYELYGATEGIGTTVLRGEDWLARPGTVGKGFCTQIRILDQQGRHVPPGTVGEVFMRYTTARHAVGRELGASNCKRTVDGFVSVGDHGWCDDDGFLYLSPRRHDMVLIGGLNVYPAEVEAALTAHPAVVDAMVLGVADELVGMSLTAQIVLAPGSAVTESELVGHVSARLAPHKVPWQVRFVPDLPRTEAGKLRRRLAEALEGEEN